MVHRASSSSSPVRMRTTRFQRGDEDFAVADFTGVGGVADGFDDLRGQVVADRDFQLEFRQEVDDVFRAAVEFGVPFLSAEAF